MMIVLVVTTLILLGKSATYLKFHLTPWRQQKLRHSLIIHSEWNLQPVQIGPEVGFRTPHMLRHPGHDPWICQDPEEKKGPFEYSQAKTLRIQDLALLWNDSRTCSSQFLYTKIW